MTKILSLKYECLHVIWIRFWEDFNCTLITESLCGNTRSLDHDQKAKELNYVETNFLLAVFPLLLSGQLWCISAFQNLGERRWGRETKSFGSFDSQEMSFYSQRGLAPLLFRNQTIPSSAAGVNWGCWICAEGCGVMCVWIGHADYYFQLCVCGSVAKYVLKLRCTATQRPANPTNGLQSTGESDWLKFCFLFEASEVWEISWSVISDWWWDTKNAIV